jgi:hypothetical protein
LNPFKDQSERRSSGSTIPAQGGPGRTDTLLSTPDKVRREKFHPARSRPVVGKLLPIRPDDAARRPSGGDHMQSNLMKSVSSLAQAKEGTTMYANKLLAVGIGILLLGVATVTPAQAGIALNGLSVNGLTMNGISMNGLTYNGLAINGVALAAPMQTEPLTLEVESVTLPATNAE